MCTFLLFTAQRDPRPPGTHLEFPLSIKGLCQNKSRLLLVEALQSLDGPGLPGGPSSLFIPAKYRFVQARISMKAVTTSDRQYDKFTLGRTV